MIQRDIVESNNWQRPEKVQKKRLSKLVQTELYCGQDRQRIAMDYKTLFLASRI